MPSVASRGGDIGGAAPPPREACLVFTQDRPHVDGAATPAGARTRRRGNAPLESKASPTGRDLGRTTHAQRGDTPRATLIVSPA